jgi:REP element-mobilizing transposase RayT
MRHHLYAHLVWTTRHRDPTIDAPLAAFLESYLPTISAQERAKVLALGIVTTHLHLLLRLHPMAHVSRMVQRLKGGSAYFARREGIGPATSRLQWAKGYSIDAVGRRSLARVGRYVLRQAIRHPEEAIADWTPARDWRATLDDAIGRAAT